MKSIHYAWVGAALPAVLYRRHRLELAIVPVAAVSPPCWSRCPLLCDGVVPAANIIGRDGR